MLLMGVTGCMSEASSQEAILTYLEEKYDEKFEVEAFDEGNEALKQMYGGDELIAHPVGKPEHVFLAGEYRERDGEYYDNYVLSIWQDELTRHYDEKISEILVGMDYEYRVLLYVLGENYDKTMKSMSAFDYFETENNEGSLTFSVAIKTSDSPDIKEYKKAIYELLQLANAINVKTTGVSIGFVHNSADVKDYIRTSAINNTPWSNMVGEVYGTVTLDNRLDINSPDKVEEYYEKLAE